MTSDAKTLHDFSLSAIDGGPLPLAQFAGKAVLMVNTASECGFTPQYDGLEKLWQQYKDRGLIVLGVPSNEFGGQEPGTETAIENFCRVNYGVTFPLSAKTNVKGKEASAVYHWAGEQAGAIGRPKWNFHKYLFGKNGRFVDWFATPTDPMSSRITTAIENELAR
jgi:glutathione peroxidase